MSTTVTPADLARYIDHTLLKPEATTADVAATVADASRLGTYSVCLSPSMLPIDLSADSCLKIAVVCGFPSGKHATEVKVAEAELAIRNGADEIDMVIDVGAAKEGRFDAIEADIAAVRAVIERPRVLKVIIESAALTDSEIVGACRAAVAADADFVKTSTGFHPAGGASVHAVELMSKTVEGKLEVKASGGIRSYDDAASMIAAGATRLGVSGSEAVLSGAPSTEPAGGY